MTNSPARVLVFPRSMPSSVTFVWIVRGSFVPHPEGDVVNAVTRRSITNVPSVTELKSRDEFVEFAGSGMIRRSDCGARYAIQIPGSRCTSKQE